MEICVRSLLVKFDTGFVDDDDRKIVVLARVFVAETLCKHFAVLDRILSRGDSRPRALPLIRQSMNQMTASFWIDL
jgi:hypothetical protein